MSLRQRARKMWAIATLEAASTLGEDVLFIIQFIFRWLRVVVLLSLWRVILDRTRHGRHDAQHYLDLYAHPGSVR